MKMAAKVQKLQERMNKIPLFRDVLNGSTLSALIALVIICIVMAFVSPYYLTGGNFKSIGLYAAIIGIMGAGATVPMLMAGLDLSQHALAALATVVIAIFIQQLSLPFGVALLAALAVGIAGGALNGLLIAVCKMPPMIATMGTQYVIRGICYILTEAKTLLFTDEALTFIGRGSLLGIPNSILIMVLVFLVIGYVLQKTPYGRAVYAVGSNEKASYLSGISPVRTKMIAYIICGVCSVLGGVITVSQVGAAVPSSGVGSEMEIIASVYLGGVAATGGRGTVVGTFLGVMVICCINNGLTLAGVQSYWQTMVRGIVILVAIYMDTLRTRNSQQG